MRRIEPLHLKRFCRKAGVDRRPGILYDMAMVPDAGGSLAGVREKAQRALSILEEAYGRPEPPGGRDPLDQLIRTVLSQNTSDTNSERAYSALREQFPTWKAVAAAPEAEVARAIQSGGLARVKAARIQHILREVQRQQQPPDLSFLGALSSWEAYAFLTRFPGVGPKTAACVLLFALGRPVLPVDTHVYRVSRRLGLFRAGTSVEEAHTALQALLRDDQVLSFHLNLIAHGRQICRASAPRCGRCVLRLECSSCTAEAE